MSSENSSVSAWEPPSPDELQRMLPQYEISGILGRGGMGAVYKGRQAKLNRSVAIKVLPETFAKGGDELNFVKRFEQEAQAMANMDHPAIISVYEFGETAEGQLYFVMEYVDGMDIHQYLQAHGGKLPQEHALAITAHVLDALGYAHGRGIVHRDIKPANIMLNREGRVKIADFGLAKKFGEHVDENALALTRSNVAVGTPDFVAPEALDGDQVPDHRADLYAVGVMLYQMLTGKLPRGNFRMPSELNPGIDPRLDEIVCKAMEADPEFRYQNAMAVRTDLDLILSEPMARVEAGETSRVVEAVVPVTSTLKGKKAARETSKLAVSLVVGVAAAAVIGIVVMLMGGAKEEKGSAGTSARTAISAVASTPPEEAGKNAGAPLVDSASKESPFENSLGMRFVPVPVAGGPTDGRTVLFSVWETRVKDYEAFVSDSSRARPAPNFPQEEDHPVVNVRYSDAVAFCDWLTDRDRSAGKIGPKDQYRLPSDHEWSCAVGIGRAEDASETPESKFRGVAVYPWGRTYPPPTGAGNYYGAETIQNPDSNIATSLTAYDDGFDRTSPVGSFTPNQLGIFDLGGNVSEWCEDLYDPVKADKRVLRGASWGFHYDGDLLSSSRYGVALDFWNLDVGFRVVLSVSESEPSVEPSSSPASSAAPSVSVADIAKATKEQPFENSLGMRFVPVPGTDVFFCIHETRYKDYAAFAEGNPGIASNWKKQTHDGFVIADSPEDHPVVYVSWEDAQAFCVWLSEKEGRTYRLPTDREWSIAVGIGKEEIWNKDTTPRTVEKTPHLFPWKKQWPPPSGSGNFSDESRMARAPRGDAKYIDGYNDGFPTTAPVMSFVPNPLGLFDLEGNALEWVEDWESSDKDRRTLRGGTWSGGQSYSLESTYRCADFPHMSHFSAGFRLVVAGVGN